MLVTNRTDTDIYHELLGPENKEYVRQRINEFFLFKSELNSNLNYIQQQALLQQMGLDLMNCKTIYTSLNDPILKILSVTLGKEAMEKSLTATCDHYNFMNTGSLDVLFEEMIYRNQYILNYLENADGDYTKMKAVNDDFEFFNMYFIALTIMRPLKVFIDNNLVSTIVVNGFAGFREYNIISLILNIIIDIGVLSLVSKFVFNMLIIIKNFISLEASFVDRKKI
jgi:hypothetical protein